MIGALTFNFSFLGLDSVSASKVASVLHSVAHDPEYPTVVIASIHQPNSQLYQKFDQVLVLSHGRTLYDGPGGLAPSQDLTSRGIAYPQGYNVADHLLDVASDPPAHLFQSGSSSGGQARGSEDENGSLEKGYPPSRPRLWDTPGPSSCATTFLTQLEVLSGREWKILRRCVAGCYLWDPWRCAKVGMKGQVSVPCSRVSLGGPWCLLRWVADKSYSSSLLFIN